MSVVWEYNIKEMNKHLWAFFYFCKRKGDKCIVHNGVITITRKE